MAIHNKEITYILDRKYSRFTGILAVSLYSKDNTEENNYMILTVYGDDVKLYESEILRGGVRPIEFNIDISNVDELVLSVQISNPCT